ncbi:hypothetical protein ES702_04029 [subsurface metagenome]
MSKKPVFIRFNTIKEYIKNVHQMRSGDKAIKKFIKEFQTAIETAIKEAKKTAKKDKRNTILEEDIILALEKHLGKKHLTWPEVAKEVIRQNPTDLGKISKAINDYMEKQK